MSTPRAVTKHWLVFSNICSEDHELDLNYHVNWKDNKDDGSQKKSQYLLQEGYRHDGRMFKKLI